ncbi:hypothetical protein SAMN05192564_102177 [Paraburkholderia sartisoli]|uniref:Uncharacterized protein n=1 Tax=Paraburkholderia sartisoli TaxID=83784 RepID=A0A1H4C8L6_9BURK|nr:hypothetical protein SAMN05192564_102177 [Paraburkholderia sartisoli]
MDRGGLGSTNAERCNAPAILRAARAFCSGGAYSAKSVLSAVAASLSTVFQVTVSASKM